MVTDGTPRRRVGRGLIAAALVAAAASTACDSSSVTTTASPPTPPTAVVQPSSPGSARASAAPGPDAPLTGLPADAAVATRPAVVVALSETTAAAPTGLGDADVVYEASLDHGASRLLAVFQSHDPAKAGPVAGTIPSDAQLLSVLHPVLADTGGSAGFVKTLHASVVLDAPPARTPRGYSRTATSWSAIPASLRTASSGASAPPPLFSYDDGAVERNRSTPATSVVITAAGRQTEQWSYDPASQRWRRSDRSGVSVSVTNLVLQTVPYESVLLHHPGKDTVQVVRPLGTGRAVVLSGPDAIAATWTKPGDLSVTNFLDGADVPVWFRLGSTWVTLLSDQAKVTVR